MNSFLDFIKRQIIQIRNGNLLTLKHKFKVSINYIFLLINIILCFPLFLAMRIFSKLLIVRFGELPSRRIGHLAPDINVHLCRKKKRRNYLDIYYFEKKPVCNYALINILRRYIRIYPRLIILPFVFLNNLKFLGSPIHKIKINDFYTGQDLRDRDVEKQINYFNSKEIEYGNNFLQKYGLSKDDKFICLICRDEEYVKDLFSNNYDNAFNLKGDNHSFRNAEIENFRLACQHLIDEGYYIFRMGSKVSKKFQIDNKKFIDYATLGIRSDFLDIFLSANCDFFLSTACGLDSVAEMFDRPILMVNQSLVATIRSTNKKHLTIPKHFESIAEQRKLNLSEIFEYNLALPSSHEIFENKKIKIKENSPIEIKDAVIEMLKLKKNNFETLPSEKEIQEKFWKIYLHNIKKYNFSFYHSNFRKGKVGTSFLKKNDNFLI